MRRRTVLSSLAGSVLAPALVRAQSLGRGAGLDEVRGGGGVVPVTPTAWNPADKSPGVTLTGSNLIATNSDNTVEGVRSVASHTTGKYYCEFTCGPFTYSLDAAGVTRAGYQLDSIGNPASGISGNCTVNQLGTAIVDGGTPTPGVSFGAIANGTVVCMAIDLTGKLAWFRLGAAGNWNANAANNPATGVGGIAIPNLGGGTVAAYAAGSLGNTNDKIIANFGGSGFVGALPSGYASGF